MLLVTACSPLAVMNAASGADDYRSHADIEYGPDKRHRMDIYQPHDRNNGCTVLFVYGGSWESGRKEQYGFVGAALARKGYTVIIPDYRLFPHVTYPAFVEDIALSLTQPLIQNLTQSQHLVMMGHSAGALIAGLVSFDPSYLAKVGLEKSIVDRYIAIAGPHDYFLPTDKPRWVEIFGEDKRQQRSALTVNHVHPDNPPTLILHGAEDDVVTPKSATSLERALHVAGVDVTRRTYADTGHRKIIAAMSRGLHFLAPTLTDIDQFLQPICTTTR